MSDIHGMIGREDERRAPSMGTSVRLTRRALLTRTAALAAAWTVSPWPIGVPSAFGQGMDRPSMTQTLEAFADTLIPGEKRFPADRAIAGVVSGAGAVQAGAIEMMNFPPVGFQPVLPYLAPIINLHALVYAATHGIDLSLTVPPLVELDFASRTALLVQMLAAGGARVIMLEPGPRLSMEEFTQSLQVGGYTRILDSIGGSGINVTAGNCVGGSSVVYYAASLRAPSFVFERRGTLGRRIWPASITRHTLDKWYRRAEDALPVSELSWDDVPYAGGVFAAACTRAGHTCQPVPVAVDLTRCTNCNWMANGCLFDAKRSMLLNYIPGADASGAEIRPLHEVQAIHPARTRGYRYAVEYRQLDPNDYNKEVGHGRINAKIVILAAGTMGTPVILQRSEKFLGDMPHAVGRHMSANGDRITLAALDEGKVRNLLGLERAPGVAYDAFPIGKPISSMTFDYLDPSAPEFSRFALQQLYAPPLSTFYGNTAGQGGAIFVGGAILDVVNSTFAGNGASIGGGIFSTLAVTTARGMVIAGSSGDNCLGEIDDEGYNISDDSSCAFTATSSRNSTNPLLDPRGLADNGGPTETIALLPGSPAINQIHPAACPATDQRKYPRPAPGQANCDIGSFELNATPSALIDCSGAKASNPNVVSLPLGFLPENILGVRDPEGPYSITITSITQDKPVRGGGLACRDGFGVGTSNAWVRASAGGKGGLIYALGFTATDSGGGGSCSGTVQVCVQELAHHGKCVDTRKSFDSTKCRH